MYKVLAHRKALKFYRKLDKKIASRIDTVIERLRKDPFSYKNIRRLSGKFAGSYREKKESLLRERNYQLNRSVTH